MSEKSVSVEQWKPIPGFHQEYEVSNQGRIRSVSRICTNGKRYKGKIISPQTGNKLGHLSVQIYRGGRHFKRWIHRAVLEAFRGPGFGDHARHLDGNPKNNALSNLEWGTPAQSYQDKFHTGTQNKRGEAHAQVKYRATDLERVKDLRRCGISMTKVASWFRMSTATVRKIELGLRA